MTPQAVAAITAARLEGKTVREIAAATDICKTTVAETLKREDVKQIVDEGSARIVREAALPAVETRIAMVKAINRAITNDDVPLPGILKKLSAEKFVELGLKECQGVRQTAGIDPSQTSTVYMTNVFNDNRDMSMPPEILALLRSQGAQEAQEAVDVEYEELDR
jgi:hypothetical protein